MFELNNCPILYLGGLRSYSKLLREINQHVFTKYLYKTLDDVGTTHMIAGGQANTLASREGASVSQKQWTGCTAHIWNVCCTTSPCFVLFSLYYALYPPLAFCSWGCILFHSNFNWRSEEVSYLLANSQWAKHWGAKGPTQKTYSYINSIQHLYYTTCGCKPLQYTYSLYSNRGG